jgi:hypothetical protein
MGFDAVFDLDCRRAATTITSKHYYMLAGLQQLYGMAVINKRNFHSVGNFKLMTCRATLTFLGRKNTKAKGER